MKSIWDSWVPCLCRSSREEESSRLWMLFVAARDEPNVKVRGSEDRGMVSVRGELHDYIGIVNKQRALREVFEDFVHELLAFCVLRVSVIHYRA